MKKHLAFLTVFVLISFSSIAKEWKIIPSESKIEFSAYRFGAKVDGKFTNFSGKIIFDKNNLEKSSADINVDTSSINVSFPYATPILKTQKWFDAENFPTAKFMAKKFNTVSDRVFKAEGELTIKNITRPVVIQFVLEQFSMDGQAKAVASLMLSRADFNIGTNDSQAEGIKNDVDVNFVVSASAR